ncbi:MAG: GAF domain-containing protein [Thermoleophilaceae bacterium]
MSGWGRRPSTHPAAEAAVAFVASAALFLLAYAIPIRVDLVPDLLLGGVYVYLVVVAARRWGSLYAVPLAIAGGLAIDSFYIPPTREFGADHWQNWLVVVIYISMGVLIGLIGARSQRRAEASEQARSRLADEQAALRRVATLVARRAPPEEVFAAVTEEVGRLFGADLAGMIRYEAGAMVTPVAAWAATGRHPPLPERWPAEDGDAAMLIATSGRPARVDDWAEVPGPIAAFVRDVGITSSVASPVLVEGRLWGALAVHTKGTEPLPAHAESRLENFTDLVATAISNAQARAEVERLANEQAALRRLATLVAEGPSPSAVFDAMVAEVGGVFDADSVHVTRFEADGTATVLAAWGEEADRVPIGARVPLEGESVTAGVSRSGSPTRIDHWEGATGILAATVKEMGVRSAVGAPFVVEGRLWGSVVASWTREELPAPDTEERMAQFAELVATAIANADSRAQLTASRARVLVAGDDARRRVVRDLHDGAQQRLVHTIVTLKLAQRAFKAEDGRGESLLAEALKHADQGNAELRELAHGILPSVLTRGGLRAGVDGLVSRIDLPVTVEVPAERLPAEIEASAYFVVAEALTNVIKHSRAETAEVRAVVDDGVLRLEVRDDGTGGAKPEGTGLVGVDDRVAALGGSLRVESPPGGGTLVAATLPLLG